MTFDLWDKYCLPPGQGREDHGPRQFTWAPATDPGLNRWRYLLDDYIDYYVHSGRLQAKLAVTSQGALIVTIGAVEVGDSVVFCQGSDWPFVLREQATDEWRFLGKAFLHGCTDTEQCVLEPLDARNIREYRVV